MPYPQQILAAKVPKSQHLCRHRSGIHDHDDRCTLDVRTSYMTARTSPCRVLLHLIKWFEGSTGSMPLTSFMSSRDVQWCWLWMTKWHVPQAIWAVPETKTSEGHRCSMQQLPRPKGQNRETRCSTKMVIGLPVYLNIFKQFNRTRLRLSENRQHPFSHLLMQPFGSFNAPSDTAIVELEQAKPWELTMRRVQSGTSRLTVMYFAEGDPNGALNICMVRYGAVRYGMVWMYVFIYRKL